MNKNLARKKDILIAINKERERISINGKKNCGDDT